MPYPLARFKMVAGEFVSVEDEIAWEVMKLDHKRFGRSLRLMYRGPRSPRASFTLKRHANGAAVYIRS